jgi:hypothetical protein
MAGWELHHRLFIGRMLCPFQIGEMIGPFFTIVNLPVRDRTIVCIFKCKARGL